VLPADLALSGAAQVLAMALQRKRIAVDVLVNNAGVLEQGAFVAMSAQWHQQLIALNVSGLTVMLASFVPPTVERGFGLNVTSVAAFQPVPTLATCAATKAYVRSLAESLAEELLGTGVTVTALCPDITVTAMLSSAARANSQLGKLPGFMVGDVDGTSRCPAR
jgi:short-subunit dehydrogenase